MEVLVTGGDTDLGRTIAESFRDAGHRVVITGARRDDLEVAAKELDVDAIVCDNTDPASLEEARSLFPHHLDTIVNVPAPRWDAGDPRTYTLADHAAAWRNALDATMLSTVLTVQVLGDHLRSGGSIVSVVPENPREGSADAAIKAAVSNWTEGQATHFGTRGITVNVVASGRSAAGGLCRPRQLGTGGRRDRPAGAVPEHAGGPPHHRADDARQQRRARPAGLIFPRSPEAKRGDRPA